jgi:hypothetical protein
VGREELKRQREAVADEERERECGHSDRPAERDAEDEHRYLDCRTD